MHKNIILLAVILFAFAQVQSQTNVSRIPLLGEEAPAFTAESTNGEIVFPDDFGSKWKILFSHPADFTPVCTSELMELALLQKNFKDLGVEIAVISPDNLERHKLWVKAMENMMYEDNKPVKITFPFIDDSKFNIGVKYGMLTASNESFKAVRGVFIIDPKNKIRAITFYPSNVGRNLDEIQRMVIALQTADKNLVLTPVNWKPGEDVLLPYPDSYTFYDTDQQNEKQFNLAWLMIYKKLEK